MSQSLEWPSCSCRRHHCGCSGHHHSFGEYYQELLEAVQPELIFEWGPGLNTELGLPFTPHIVSVEQSLKWVPQPLIADQVIIHTPVESSEYVESARHYKDADIFFVDSRRRAECLEFAHSIKKKDAYVCLHDAQRSRYHNALRLFSEVKFPHKGFAICK